MAAGPVVGGIDSSVLETTFSVVGLCNLIDVGIPTDKGCNSILLVIMFLVDGVSDFFDVRNIDLEEILLVDEVYIFLALETVVVVCAVLGNILIVDGLWNLMGAESKELDSID